MYTLSNFVFLLATVFILFMVMVFYIPAIIIARIISGVIILIGGAISQISHLFDAIYTKIIKCIRSICDEFKIK